MKNFLIIPNRSKPYAEAAAERIRTYLMANGAETVMISERVPKNDSSQKPECILTLGGDGTLIRAARETADPDLPIAGINLGHLGYLTSAAGEQEIFMLLDALLSDSCIPEKRMMLSCTVRRVSEGGIIAEHEIHVLNEAVISRKIRTSPALFRVLVNGAFLNEYKADGIIISTPTGSTAYNLSAGGPIVEPTARMTVLTPICPHSLNRGSIVLKAEDTIEIVVPEEEQEEEYIDFDGAVSAVVRPGDSLCIRESERTTTLLRVPGGTFFTQLRNKMNIL